MSMSMSMSIGGRLAFACAVVVALSLVGVADAYVYPLPASIGTRPQTNGVPHAVDGHPSAITDNLILSTGEYEKFGAQLNTARYSFDGKTKKFTPLADSDCAVILNDVLIGHAQAGLLKNVPGLAGMIALAAVRTPTPANAQLITRYWTVSSALGVGALTELQLAGLVTANTMLNKLGIANTQWEFLEPSAPVPGLAVTPENQCLATTAPAAFLAPAGPGVQDGADFCFSSHPFAEYRYRQQRQTVGAAVRRTFGRVDSSGNMVDGFAIAPLVGVGPAPNVGIPVCQCAGSRLGAALQAMGVYQSPATAALAVAQNGLSKSAWQQAQMAAAKGQAAANDRVVCFAESRNRATTAAGGRNPGYEVSGAGGFDPKPTAASCTTCQVQLQLMYGNVPVAGHLCGDAAKLAAQRKAGRANWSAVSAQVQSRAFIDVDAHVEHGAPDGEAPAAAAAAAAGAMDAPLLHDNRAAFRSRKLAARVTPAAAAAAAQAASLE